MKIFITIMIVILFVVVFSMIEKTTEKKNKAKAAVGIISLQSFNFSPFYAIMSEWNSTF